MANSYYSFLPHIRQGLNNLNTVSDTYAGGTLGSDRISIPLNIPVTGNKISGGTDLHTVTQSVNLKGPGDIIGINSDMIVKVSPANWITNMEPNYLPFIEFYDEDFPWRYTPAKARVEDAPNHKFRLRPWISLVVLQESEFTTAPFNGVLPSIKISAAANNVFPNEKQMWAWAHVHVNDDLGNNISDPTLGLNKLKSILKDHPDLAVSRIICPRRLVPNMGYHAFLIPTFEAGRRAGIGQDPTGVDGLAPSWTWGNGTPNTPSTSGSPATPAGTEYPVYYQWFFKTGAAGDFESLVRLLSPRAVGNEVGKRQVDLQRPGNPILDTTSPAQTIGLQGVLHPPTQLADAWVPAIADPLNFVTKLASIINAPSMGTGDPIVAPPVYGRWHAAVPQVSTTAGVTANWLQTANLDPRYRIFAGIGAEVIRKNQDKYMAIAWEQVGAVIEANKKIMQMQAAMQASAAMHTKHVVALPDEMVLNTSSAVHGRVRMLSATVYKNIADSALPNSVFSGAFRRMTGPGTTVMESLNMSGTPVTTRSMIQDLNSGAAMIAPPYAAPSGMISYDIWGMPELTPGFTASLPTLMDFAITVPGTSLPAFSPGPPGPVSLAFTTAVEALHTALSTMPSYTYVSGPALDMATAATAVRNGTNPRTNLLLMAQDFISTRIPVTETVAPITAMDLILAAPKINVFMYKELAELSTEWIMPGLNGIPDNSMNVLQMDQTYIEAFMLGVNHEMSRLLLWRGYPTDQRGTYFSFFWGYNNVLGAALLPDTNLDDYKDIWPINQWRTPLALHPISGPLSLLGQNSHRPNLNTSTMLVFTIRAELFRKFPGTIVYMQEAAWQLKTSPSSPTDYDYSKPRIINTGATQYPGIGTTLYPVFSATLNPDIYFLGFNIDAATAKGVMSNPAKPGYFFVFQERAGELKFGADEPLPGATYSSTVQSPSGPTVTSWNDLNWGHIQLSTTANLTSNVIFIDTNYGLTLNNDNSTTNPDSVQWAQNSASMAYSLLQLPVKLDVHANSLIQ